MGMYSITIQGAGPHHNPQYPEDADRMAEEFVERLNAAGHTITSATFHHGGCTNLMPNGLRSQVPLPVAAVKKDE